MKLLSNRIYAFITITVLTTHAFAQTPKDYTPKLDYQAEVTAATSLFRESLKTDSSYVPTRMILVGNPMTLFSGRFFSSGPVLAGQPDPGGWPISGRVYALIQPYLDEHGDLSVIDRLIRVDDTGEVNAGHQGIWYKTESEKIALPFPFGKPDGIGTLDIAKRITNWLHDNYLVKDAGNPLFKSFSNARVSVQLWKTKGYQDTLHTPLMVSQENKNSSGTTTIYLTEIVALDKSEKNPKKQERPISSLHFLITFEKGKNPSVQIVEMWEPGEYG